MKRESLLCLVFLICMLAVAGCSEQKGAVPEQQIQTKQKDENDENDKKEKKEYEFVDVEGNRYKAELLDDVKKCAYDYSRLSTQNGYPCYLDEKGETSSMLGIDVSKYQGSVDWNQVKAAGVDFVIIRLGFRGYGEEGKLVLDERFDEFMQGAQAAGLQTGVYFFSQAINMVEAELESDFVLEHLANYQIEGPVVFDTEEIKDDVARTDVLNRTEITDHCITFCNRIEQAGYQPMIYANMKWMAFTLELERLEDYEKWYADYEAVPQCPYEFSIWQYTETGTIPGIEGNVDLNLWFQKEPMATFSSDFREVKV